MLECFLVLCSYCSCVNNDLLGQTQVFINIAKYEHCCRSWISGFSVKYFLDILWRPFGKNQKGGA